MAIRRMPIQKKAETYGDVEEIVDQAGGITSFVMHILRDVHGAGKLGVHVVSGISNELDARGLAHYPEEIPTDQYARVKVYRKNSTVGKLMSAALSVDETSNVVIRQLCSSEADKIVQRIRELVCD
jgi:hypothetical protein